MSEPFALAEDLKARLEAGEEVDVTEQTAAIDDLHEMHEFLKGTDCSLVVENGRRVLVKDLPSQAAPALEAAALRERLEAGEHVDVTDITSTPADIIRMRKFLENTSYVMAPRDGRRVLRKVGAPPAEKIAEGSEEGRIEAPVWMSPMAIHEMPLVQTYGDLFLCESGEVLQDAIGNVWLLSKNGTDDVAWLVQFGSVTMFVVRRWMRYERQDGALPSGKPQLMIHLETSRWGSGPPMSMRRTGVVRVPSSIFATPLDQQFGYREVGKRSVNPGEYPSARSSGRGPWGDTAPAGWAGSKTPQQVAEQLGDEMLQHLHELPKVVDSE